MSVGVGRMFETYCLFVCLFVCPQHNSQTNDLTMFKLGITMILGYTRSDMVLILKGQGHRINKCIFHTKTVLH